MGQPKRQSMTRKCMPASGTVGRPAVLRRHYGVAVNGARGGVGDRSATRRPEESACGAPPPATAVPGATEGERGRQFRFRRATPFESIGGHRLLLHDRERGRYRRPIDLGEIVGGGPGTTTPRQEGNVRRRFGRGVVCIIPGDGACGGLCGSGG